MVRPAARLLLPPFEWLGAQKRSTSIPSSIPTTSLSMRKCLRHALSSRTANVGSAKGSQSWNNLRTYKETTQPRVRPQKRTQGTHNGGDSTNNNLIQPHRLVLVREVPQELIKVVPERREQHRWSKGIPASSHQERDRLLLEPADALNDGDDGFEARDTPLLLLDGGADTGLLASEVGAAFVDSLSFAGEGSDVGGDGRGEEGEVVAEFGELGWVGGAGTESREGEKRLGRELSKERWVSP